MAAHAEAGIERYSRTTLGVTAICWATIVADGYDLIVYGAVVPSLLDYRPWALTPATAGLIGSAALVGMLIGTLVVGAITDIVGRRKIMLVCITWFSLAMGLCAIAPSPELFGLARFVTGLGLGGVIPTAIALTIEYAPRGRRNFTNAVMFTGYNVGGVIAALLAITLVPTFGFRVMFVVGMAPLVLILPLAYRFVPESVEFLLANDRRDEAEELARRYDVPIAPEAPSGPRHGDAPAAERRRLEGVYSLFSRGYVGATLLFAAATFLGLLLVYGLLTWLPQIMRQAGYPLGSALAFLLVLSAGATFGTIAVALAADRFGAKRATALSFLAASLCIFLLSLKLPAAALYLLVAVAGLGTIGATILVNSFCGTHYPASSRATALAWSLGIGRLGAISGPIFGGLILGSGLALEWNFYAFALAALIAAVVVALIPRAPVGTASTATTGAVEPASGTATSASEP